MGEKSDTATSLGLRPAQENTVVQGFNGKIGHQEILHPSYGELLECQFTKLFSNSYISVKYM